MLRLLLPTPATALSALAGMQQVIQQAQVNTQAYSETSSLLTVVAAVYFPPAGPPTSRSATTTHVRLFKCVLVAGIL